MTEAQWQNFFEACAESLGQAENWCSWTTFTRLRYDAMYWAAGLPKRSEFDSKGIKDGGTWGQPFRYSDLAHVIVPQHFMIETPPGPSWSLKEYKQDVAALSKRLGANGIDH